MPPSPGSWWAPPDSSPRSRFAAVHQQDSAEDVEHPAEHLDETSPQQNEPRPGDQGQHDPEQQHLLLVPARHPEAADDDQEHEQVVHRERLLRQIPGVVLQGRVRAGHDQHEQPEQQAEPHVHARPPGGLTQGGLVGLAHMGEEVEEQKPDDGGDGEDPSDEGDVHGGVLSGSATEWGIVASLSARSPSGLRTAPSGGGPGSLRADVGSAGILPRSPHRTPTTNSPQDVDEG